MSQFVKIGPVTIRFQDIAEIEEFVDAKLTRVTYRFNGGDELRSININHGTELHAAVSEWVSVGMPVDENCVDILKWNGIRDRRTEAEKLAERPYNLFYVIHNGEALAVRKSSEFYHPAKGKCVRWEHDSYKGFFTGNMPEAEYFERIAGCSAVIEQYKWQWDREQKLNAKPS